MTSERLSILIVDDQARARKSLKALLSTWVRALEIHEAGDGREAVRLVEQFPPDLVLMDVRMPELDGIEATRQIKARWPHVKVVVLSMYAEHREEALATGADAFVGKGEASDALLSLLDGIL